MHSDEKDGCRLKFGDGCMTVFQLKRKSLRATRCAFTFTKENPTDVTLKIGDTFSYKAHKVVLKESVPYFKAMFSDNFQEADLATVNLSEDVEQPAVTKLMGFIYRGTFEVSATEVQAVFQLSDQWGLTNVREICCVYMAREMDASNCLDLLQFSETFSCASLTDVCRQVVTQQFAAVSFSDAFLELESSRLMSLLQIPNLNLGPLGEDFLVDCVLRWLHHDLASRTACLFEVQRYLDISSVSTQMKHKWAEELKTLSVSDEGGTGLQRSFRQHFMVFCGYLQSRTGLEQRAFWDSISFSGPYLGPSCPRTAMVERFDLDTGLFQSLQQLPECPSYGKALNLFGKIVYLSVTVETDPKTDRRVDCMKVWTYKPHLDLWQITPDVFSAAAVQILTACLVNEAMVVHCALTHKIYGVQVDGGVCIKVACTDGDVHCDIDCKLPSLIPKLAENHSGFQAVCLKGRLFVLGGCYGPLMDRVCSSQVLCLRQDGEGWDDRAPMLIPRTNCSAAVLGNQIYVTGGYGGVELRRRQRSCEVYCAKTDTWRDVPPLRQSRSHHCTVALGNRLYTIGGKSYACEKINPMSGWHPAARVVSDYVEVIEPDSRGAQWDRLARMTKSRCHFSALVV